MKLSRISLIVSCTCLCLAVDNGISQERSLEELLNIPVSTASKYEQAVHEAPASVTIITSEDIEQYGYRTLEEVLMSDRGFYVSNDRNYSYLGVRGFGRPTDWNNRILLLLNGHTHNDGVYGSVAIGTTLGLDIDCIERIEIVRGPGSALYGTGAMFCVVNIITKNGNTLDGMELSAEAGSYGRLRGTAAFGKELKNGMDVFVSGQWTDIKGDDLYYEEYDDPSTNDGIAENLDWDKNYGLLTSISHGDFTLLGTMTSRKKGVPTGAWEMFFNDADASTLDQQQFIELKFDRIINASKHIMVRGFYDYYNLKATYPYEDEPNWWDATTNRWLGGEIRFRWDTRPNNRLIVGTEYQRHLQADYRYGEDDEEYFNGDFPFSIFSIYLHDEYQVIRDLSLTLGLRWDEYSTVGSSVTPRAAIVFNPIKSSTLKLLYGEAFRAPNVYEANYEEIDYWEANPNLKPEQIRTTEIIWEQRLSKDLFGTVSFYQYKMKDLIDVIERTDELFQYQNISKVSARGIELGLQGRLRMGFRGYMNYAYQDAKDTDLDEKLTNSPSHLLKAGLICPLFKTIYVAAELLYESERMTVYDTETDAYFLTNINLSTRPLFNHLRFSFRIRNLFDVDYRFPGGFEHLQPSIAQNGRNFIAKLELGL